MREGGVTMFKVGNLVWCKDETNCNGDYRITKYHVPCVVCDIRYQSEKKIAVAPIIDDERIVNMYYVNADLFELVQRNARVV